MKPLRPIPYHRGFTLIELLVVMTVLSMFLMMTTIVTRDALDLHSATRARLVSERNAAAFMRQFDSDIFQRVNRDDARVRFKKQQDGNDEIAFVTKRQGYVIHGTTAERRASLVSYRIKQNMLERAASGYGFGSTQDRPAEDQGTLALKEIPAEGPEDPAAKAFQVIAPAIIRLEFSFLVREENTSTKQATTNVKHVLRAKPPKDPEQIVAVIATIATLDPDRSRMLNDTKLGLIAKRFPDATDNELPSKKWAEIAANLTRQMPDMPRSALQQVRVHQGVFTLTSRIPLP
ncbi:MAG: prepilin-type N-terminal cleavage/methylation domain-containing protein [Verrucomicrobia bacterium]|nr:prepilin-type N-terminal cleavage/methylation domain-containing protein [Verrucomicrobiota bacterium]